MKNSHSCCGGFLSISMLLAIVSLTTGRGRIFDCPPCRCSTHPTNLPNRSVTDQVEAFCHYKSGPKMSRIPLDLPSGLIILKMTSQQVRELDTTSLNNYSYLQHLFLDKNNLETIQVRTFSQQQFLTKLDLKENKLVNISAGTFQGLKSLRSLRLDHNNIQRISRGIFSFVPMIEYIDLSFNAISVVEEGAFDRLDNLKTLLLNGNQLRRIYSGTLGNLMSLTRLELASNQIHAIDEGVFRCSPLVKTLVLKANKLDRIPKESIGDLQFLNFLNISRNPISYVESDALVGLPSLKTIELKDCNISGIQNNTFFALKKVSTVDLENNPLKCDCHLSWFKIWLSRKPEVTLKGAVCRAPLDISGQNLLSANLRSFVCTCADCTKKTSCSIPPSICSCTKNSKGLSCNDICQSYNESVTWCRKFDGNCSCKSNAVVLEKHKTSSCSFNITSEKCSEYGEITKKGVHLDCVCKKGFTGNGIICTDINECEIGRVCPFEHQECINTMGSYTCECRKGFRYLVSGIVGPCEDIDECKENKPCDVNAECHNNKGSYTCTCLTGYTRKGETCLSLPDKPVQVKVMEIKPNEVTVTWRVANNTIIRHFKVEYKQFGKEWQVIKIQTPRAQAHLKDLESDSTYLVRIGAFSIFNTSIYSDEISFETPAIDSGTTASASDGQQNSTVIVVALVVSIAVLAIIAFVLYLLMKRRKTKKKRHANPQFPGLEDLIEMRSQTHSGRPEAGGNRDLMEIRNGLHSFTSCTGESKDKWEIPRDVLVIGQKIGEGQFGLVLEGTLMTEEGPLKVAVKTIKENADRFDIKDLLQEMEMMKEIGQHPHIVSLVGTCTTPGPLYIVTEYVSGGNLLDYLRASRPEDETYVNVTSTLTSRDLLKIALDCARGMNHIADKKFVHRDLAARNILLTEEHEAKVADFGLARDIYGDGQYVKTGGGKLPIKWMAPESIQDQVYTTMSDVWSFGVLLWEIVTIGGSPYPYVPLNLLLTKLLCGFRMSKPSHCSDELYDLMKSCWDLDPEARPNFSELCHTLSEMLSESARSYVNVIVSDERVHGHLEESADDALEQTTSV